jgi:hypothetical protein
MTGWRVGLVAILALGLGRTTSDAHPAQFTTLQMTVDSTGAYRGTLNIDILSYALGQTSQGTSNDELQALLDGPRSRLASDLAEAGVRFQRELVIHTDAGNSTPSSWALPGLPEVNEVLARHLQPPILMPGDIEFAGTLPMGARTISIRLPYIMGDTVQVYELPNGGSHDEPVSAGEMSSSVALEMPPAGTDSRLADFARYVAAGFRHIVPNGWDHILFALGLFLLSPRLGPLLWQVSAFTLAHSITLSLSIYGVIRLPPAVTEPLVAASIVCVAVENLYTSKLSRWRTLVVFGFGLIHGLGFANAFARIGLPRSDFLVGVVGFNAGVECGQLAVIAAAFLCVGWFRRQPWYREAIVVPASGAIAVIAAIWVVERIWLVR